MTEADWLRLCVYMEARGEPDDGKAAVAKVVMNRALGHYSSTGTIESAVTWPSQFSWCEFDMVDGKYQRVCTGLSAIQDRAAKLMEQAVSNRKVWSDCAVIADAVRAETYRGSAAFSALTPDTVLYANLAEVAPVWVKECREVIKIGNHTFFEPGPTHGIAAP